MKSIKYKINELRQKILKYEYFYHTLDQPIISDAEYDYLLNQLYNLELKNKKFITFDSPTQKIGSNALDKFKKTIHFFPMLSLNNTFNKNGYLEFENKIQKICKNSMVNFCCELKLDGIAVSLIYENGVLIRASTRGNGYIGENITDNIRTIKSIPINLKGLKIPQRLEIRGEIFMLKSDFFSLNKKFRSNQEKCFSNPRNAAAGSLRQINSKITSERNLQFFCHGYGFFPGIEHLQTHYDRMIQFSEWGIPINKNILICSNNKDVFDFYKHFERKRHFLNFEIDGIVIKVNSIVFQKNIGYNSKFPKWAIAWKFSAKEAITKLKNIKFQVGRTGIITPVAYFDPVYISGVRIRKSSLYNKHEINKLNLYINDYVTIRRCGDVIPKIINVLLHKRSHDVKKIIFPTSCPSCGSSIFEDKEEKIIRCYSGLMCHSQKKQLFYHFFSKNALFVDGLGLKIIHQLIKRKIVVNLIDFFYLDQSKLMEIDKIGEKKSNNIINAIQKSKKTTLKNFIYALGIPSVGIEISEKLSKNYMTINKLIHTKLKTLECINGIGLIIAKKIFNYFSIFENKCSIMQLSKQLYFFDTQKEQINHTKNIFINKKIVVTGTFFSFSRNEIQNILVNFGASIKNTVSKNTDMLIYGEKVGRKFYIANQLNIFMINEEMFKKYIQ